MNQVRVLLGILLLLFVGVPLVIGGIYFFGLGVAADPEVIGGYKYLLMMGGNLAFFVGAVLCWAVTHRRE